MFSALALNNSSLSRDFRELLGLEFVGNQAGEVADKSSYHFDIPEEKMKVFYQYGINSTEAKILSKIIEENASFWKQLGFEKKYIKKGEKEFRHLPRSLFYVLTNEGIRVFIQCKKHNIPIVGKGLDMVYTISLEYFKLEAAVTSSIVFHNTEISPGVIRTAETKRKIASRLKHVFGVVKDAKSIVKLMHTHDYKNRIGIAKTGFWFEYCELGDLEKWWSYKGALSAKEKYRILLDVIQGLEALHNSRLCHFDIKPANIFLYRSTNREIRAKLGDLGFAAGPHEFSGAGTPRHMAPEYWEGSQSYRDLNGYKMDIFALGDLFWKFATGDYFISDRRFNEISALESSKSAQALKKEFLTKKYPSIPKGKDTLYKLAAEMLQKNPCARPRSINAVHSRFKALNANPIAIKDFSVWKLCQHFEKL